MSRKGTCWDNAVVESFFSSLKMELIHETDFATRAGLSRSSSTSRSSTTRNVGILLWATSAQWSMSAPSYPVSWQRNTTVH
jgi:transposase InsO family protein